jgi:Rrf2 family protein
VPDIVQPTKKTSYVREELIAQPEVLMVSRTAEHALRALLYLARRQGEGPVPVDVIAREIEAPRNYLSKILYLLAQHGLVDGVRGVHGGFVLAAAPEQVTLARLFDLFDEPRASGQCLLGGRACDPAAPCAAHERWSAIRAVARAPLTTTTIADLLGRRAGAAADSGALPVGRAIAPATL